MEPISTSKQDLINKRRYARYHMMGVLPFRFIDEDGNVLTTFPIDLSKNGLGLAFDRNVSVGKQVLMVEVDSSATPVKLRLIWSFQMGEDELYRAGLEVVDKGVNLEDIFRKIPSVQLEDMSQ